MTLEQMTAQAEYTSQHCGKEYIPYHRQVLDLIAEVKYLRARVKQLNDKVCELERKASQEHINEGN